MTGGAHRRRSIRLRGYDYARTGAYFVTACTLQRECLFGDVVNGSMQLNEAGQTAEKCWIDIMAHFPDVELDEFVVMPNHIHGIIVIHGLDGNVGATHASPLHRPSAACGPKSRSLGAIVGSFKSAVSKQINQNHSRSVVSVWQRNYWEHVVWDEGEMGRIRKYIFDNPVQWKADDMNPTRS